MIFADDGDDVFGATILMKFEVGSGRDGVVESGNGNQDIQESVVERENRSHDIIDSE